MPHSPELGSILLDLAFLAAAIPVSVIDLRERRIPDRIVFPAIACLIALNALFRLSALPYALAAAALAALFLLAVMIATKGLGLGDVKFALLMGLYCGLEAIFPAFLIAAVGGLIVAAALLLTGRIDRKTPIPFGPFLAAGAIASRFLTPTIVLIVDRLVL